ncbi:hypothetical protein G6F31_017288 [Rhizopus arrhizus]|nr:hypothetical protein G6F31_017288 [Rhizopus arrhizus]
MAAAGRRPGTGWRSPTPRTPRAGLPAALRWPRARAQYFGWQEGRGGGGSGRQHADEAARLQASNAAGAQPTGQARLVRFGYPARPALPIGRLGEGMRAHRVVDLARTLAARLQRQLDMAEHRPPVIAGDQRQPVAAQQATCAQLLQRVRRFGTVIAMEADAAIAGGLRVLRLRSTVGKQHEGQPPAA